MIDTATATERLERRAVALEIRAEGTEEQPVLVGYAARFNEPSVPIPFVERIRPGAFRRTLEDGRDVLALVDHDTGKVLGRRSNGTLELTEDDQGLLVRISPNLDTSYGRDVVAAVRRGDLKAMSIGFIVRREEYVNDPQLGGIREIVEADLREVSVVSMPAYPTTSVATRAEEGDERKVTETPVAQGERTVSADPVLATPAVEARAASAFVRYLRGEPYDTRAMVEGTLSAGGYLAPESFEAELIRYLTEASVMRQVAQVVGPIAARSIKWPRLDSGATAAWTAENTAITPSDPAFSQVEFTPFKLAVMTLVSNELLADSAINVEALLAQLFGEEFAAKEDEAFFNGNGTGRPKGILQETAIQTVTTAAANAITADELIDLYDNVPAQYRRDGVWIMHPQTMNQIRKLKDSSGQYLLVQGLAGAAPTTILGRPVFLSSNMPTVAANAKTVIFGDVRRAYKIVDGQGIDIQRSTDRYFEQDLTAFRATKRVDGKVVLPDAVRILKQAAA